MFCSKCGKEINDEAVICVHCGCAVDQNNVKSITSENKDWVVAMLLSWFLGGFGAHRFYTGHIATAIAQLLTLGGCGIWALIDWISICFNKFKDENNKPLKNYKKDLGIALFVIGLFIDILVSLSMIVSACAESSIS